MASQQLLTLLLTDIEDSTALWEQWPDAMAHALVRHDALVSSAVQAAGGQLVKSKGEGDATFSVFELATSAVHAAADLQAKLSAESWPAETPIHVRMSIYTGEVVPRDGDYYGSSVNRAARLRALAAGDQALVASSTAAMARDRLPAGLELVDLGEHRLKDLTHPEHIYELRVVEIADGASRAKRPQWAERILAGGVAGRDQERKALTRLWESANLGNRSLAVLCGEPGIGKTTLAACIALEVHEAAGEVLYGRWQEEHLASYRGFRQALGAFAAACPKTVLRNDIGAGLDEIARVVPAAAARVGGARPAISGEPDAERLRLFEAIDRWIAAVAARQPVLLVLDDVQWADPSSLLLLRHLLEAPDPVRLLVVATVRAGDPGERHVDQLVGGLHRAAAVERFNLDGLEVGAVAEMIEEARPDALVDATSSLAEVLRDETAGNPFFLRQIIRHLGDIGALDVAPISSVLTRVRTDLPETLRDVVQWRLAQLGDPCQRAMATAAVIGLSFPVALLARVLDVDELNVLDMLDEAAAAGLVSERGSGDQYAFVHAVVARTLVDQLARPRRSRVHRRVAEVLENRADINRVDPAEIAHHYREAAATGVADRAIAWSRRAAELATAQAAFETGAQLYAAALTVLNDFGPVDPLVRCELLLELAAAYDRSGDFIRRDALYLEAAECARSLGRHDLFCRAALGFRGQLPSAVSPDPEALSLVREALDQIGSEPTAERALLLARLGHLLHFLASHDERAGYCQEALANARHVGDDTVVASVMLTTMLALEGPDDVHDQLSAAEEILEIAGRTGNRELELQAYRVRLGAELQLDYERALQTADLVRALAEKLRHPDQLRLARMIESLRYGASGRYDDAYRVADALRGDLARMGHPQADSIHFVQTFSWRWFRADVVETLSVLDELKTSQPRALPWRALTAWALVAVDLDAASTELDSISPDELRAFDQNYSWMPTMCAFAVAASSTGHAPIAAVASELLTPYEQRCCVVGFTAFHGVVRHHLGALDTVLGRADEAVLRLEHALSDHRRLGVRPYVALTASELARATGDLEQVVALEGEVTRLADELDLAIFRTAAFRRG